jgi:DNA repair protein RecO
MSDPDIFLLLERLLGALDEGAPPRVCGLWGQARLLQLLGLSPDYSQCVLCDSSDVSGFSAFDGGMLCEPCYSGRGFAVPVEALSLCRSLAEFELDRVNDALEPVSVRVVGRIYKEHYQEHLGVDESVFRRILPAVKRREP